MTRTAAIAILVALPLTVAAAPLSRAHAQPPSGASSTENRALAETLFFTGRGMMEAKRYADAAVKLAESYRLDPAPGTLLNLAVCHQKIGKVASAWGEFRQALADAKRAGRTDREELAVAAIAELEPELPWLSIEVPSPSRVPGLEISRNGLPISSAAWATELPVDPGEVEIVTRAPGYTPKAQKVQIEKKQHLTVQIERLDLAPIVTRPAEGWSMRRKTGVAVLGFGVTAATIGAAFGAAAIGRRLSSDRACDLFDGERRCTQAGVDDMSKARAFAWISDVGIGVGAIAIVAGAYLFITGGDTRQVVSQPTTGSVRVWMSVGSGNAQGFVGGAF